MGPHNLTKIRGKNEKLSDEVKKLWATGQLVRMAIFFARILIPVLHVQLTPLQNWPWQCLGWGESNDEINRGLKTLLLPCEKTET